MGILDFLVQSTSLSNKTDDKIKETYLQAYYTNDMKLKIRISKVIFIELSVSNGNIGNEISNHGNNKDIILESNRLIYFNNDNINSVKLTITPR